MSQANYRSTRLLVEAINREIEDLRKTLMSVEPAAMPDRRGDVFAPTVTLRGLVDQLAEKADRVALADVRELAPADYVATMKPLVAEYHRLLAARDLLAPCLREDLGLNAVVLIMMDETRSIVRAIHRQDRPEFELAVGAVVAAIEVGAKKAMEGEILDLEARLGATPTVPKPELAGDDLERQQDAQPDGLGVDESSGCPHDRIDHRKCNVCGRTKCIWCRKPVPDFDGITDWYCSCVRPGAAPCQGEHDEPCGSEDCYVLASIRRNAGYDEDEE